MVYVDSGWVREKLPELYEMIMEQLQRFAADSMNSVTDEDVVRFQRGWWEVLFSFNQGNLDITIGATRQDIANQVPLFGPAPVNDWLTEDEIKTLAFEGEVVE